MRSNIHNDNKVYNKAARVEFRVVEWNPETRKGIIKDQHAMPYNVSAEHLADPSDQLKPSEIVTGEYKDWETIINILPERPVDLGKHIQIPIIECPEKRDVKNYVEHLANTNQLPQIPASKNEPWCVQGSVLQAGAFWSVILVPAGERLDGERKNYNSSGASNAGSEYIAELRGKQLEGGKPQQFGTPHDGKTLPGRKR